MHIPVGPVVVDVSLLSSVLSMIMLSMKVSAYGSVESERNMNIFSFYFLDCLPLLTMHPILFHFLKTFLFSPKHFDKYVYINTCLFKFMKSHLRSYNSCT